MSASDLNFATSLANPTIRSRLRQYMDSIDWSDMARNVIDFFDQRVGPGEIPRFAEMRSFLSDKCVTEEVETIIGFARDYVMLPDDKIPSILGDFRDFYYRKSLTKILNSEESPNPDRIITKIKDLEDIKSTGLPLVTLGDLDVESVMQEELGGMDVIPSSFDFIRRATPWSGYLRGQLVMWVAAPGVGKSLAMLNEVVSFLRGGYKVYWVALGDMMRMDFITRTTTIIKGLPFSEVSLNPKRYFDDEVKLLTRNLQLTVLPAGEIDARNLADFIESETSIRRDVDVIVLDYDANLAETVDSMYSQGKEVYNMMLKLARPAGSKYRLCMVASQPKPMYWGEKRLPKECAAESSGKQHIVDMMVTIGRDYSITDKHAGIMMAAKVRRGDEGIEACYIRTASGVLKEVDRSEYTLLQSHSSQGNQHGMGRNAKGFRKFGKT